MCPSTTELEPIADALLEIVDGETVILGSRCNACETVAFPAQPSCPRCTSQDVRPHVLERFGTLWTWTTQGFRPKSPPYTGPETFEQYGVGYVELGGEIRVEGRLTESDPDRLRIGMPMEVTSIVVSGPDGEDRLTYAFAPQERAA